MDATPHQSQLAPDENKFHVGNGTDGYGDGYGSQDIVNVYVIAEEKANA